MNAQLKPSVLISSESYSDALIEEMLPLLHAHWREIATFKDKIPLDPDFELYKRLDHGGKLLCLTARLDDRLIGYSVFLLTNSGHYKSTLVGLNDVIYVEPEHRKGSVGLRLIRESEKRLKALGVIKVTWHVKPNTDMAVLMMRLGYRNDEIMFAQVF